jgi:hypothetical protein
MYFSRTRKFISTQNIRLFITTDNTTAQEEEQTTQWPKEEEQTTQWPKVTNDKRDKPRSTNIHIKLNIE